jgi:prolyl-tRNA synthetase
MKLSKLFTQTYREAPADAELISHQLSIRAGLVRPLASGIFSFLPLGLRVKHKIEQILREEMEAIDCAEIVMPVVHPSSVWEASGRWSEVGDEMLRMQDRAGRDMCLAMTHEEVMADLARHCVRSYKQLPTSVFQIQTKFRDEPRSRGGLIRVREFTMKDAYSFSADQEGLDKVYDDMFKAYMMVFNRVGLGDDVRVVESDTGMMGGSGAHEFMFLNEYGEDTLLMCEACGYKANRQVATHTRDEVASAEPQPIEEIETPDTTTIEDLAKLLGIEASQTAKAMFYVAKIDGEDKFIFAVVRGDHELNETKLTNAVKATEMRPATEEEIRAIGSEPGYGSPVGVKGVTVVVDPAVAEGANFVAGANKVGYHLKNVNAGRDFEPDIVTDLVAVEEGMSCPTCGSALGSERGIEVGNIFKLGTKYTEGANANVLDEDGKTHPVIMGSYGIGVDRMIACIIEAFHDDNGIIWPAAVAPFVCHIVVLAGKQPKGELEAAEELKGKLETAGIDVLLDDRDERAGVKFNDADLIGCPVRITVGARGLENGTVEVKRRDAEDKDDVAIGDLVSHVEGLVGKD